MMTEMEPASPDPVRTGFAVLCEPEGRISTVIQNDSVLSGSLEAGQAFLELFDASSTAKASQLLMDARLQGAAYGSELVVATVRGPKVYTFAGFWRADAVLLVGAPSADRLSDLCAEVEGADHSLLRMQRRRLRPLETADTNEVFEDLTEINNELVGQMRAVQKQNRRLSQEVTQQKEQLTLLSEAVREFSLAAHAVKGDDAGGNQGSAPPGFLETYGQMLGDLCLFIRVETESAVTPMVKSRRSVRLAALAEEAAAMNRTWWKGIPIAIVVNDHDPGIEVAVNRLVFRNALAVLVAACVLSATADTQVVIDCHCKDDTCCLQLSFVSSGKAPNKFRFPQVSKRLLAENGFKATILRGSLDRLTVILRQADPE